MESTIYFETQSTDPAYNLAFEEYILTNYRHGNIIILWQNRNSVIIGRNQNTGEEINQQFVDEHGIRVVRRNTGGGAVYHDLGNLNYSFISDVQTVDRAATTAFVQPVIDALKSLGLDAACSGRNDILVSGKKISGTAQQLSKGRLLLHGTLLFDSDPAMISGALNPDPTKFQSKSVKSVRSRVGNIRSFLMKDMDITSFWTYLKQRLTDSNVMPRALCDDELAEIQKLKTEKYDTWEWNYGKSPKFDMRHKKRWMGGLLDIHLSVSSGKISQIKIFGDFLAVESVAPLEELLLACPYRKDALIERTLTFPIGSCLGTITAQELAETILGAD